MTTRLLCTSAVLGSASLNLYVVGTHGGVLRQVEDAEPNTDTARPVSRELGDAISDAHIAWARRYAPHLLQEWIAA